jgi:hypothetical protein
MNLPELFEEIESLRFAVGYGVVASFKVLKHFIRDDETLKQVIAALEESPDKQQAVYQRLNSLLPRNDQPEYAHPFDSAIMGYLYALNQAAPDLGQQAAELVFHTPKLHWAWWLAKEIVETPVETK